MAKHWDRPAMRIASARYLRRQRLLEVEFENGERFRVPTESLLPVNGASRRAGSRRAGRVVASPDWANLRIGETGDVIEVPANGTVVEIPWDRIRSLADPAFRAYWTKRATARGRHIGGRVRSLRRQAGLTRLALAEMAGVSRQTLANLEAGKLGTSADLLEPIAVALGLRLRDFAEK